MPFLSAHTIKSSPGSRRLPKRVGRGLGSTGSYSGRGVKGQRARSGVSGLARLGMRRLILSTPKKRGFQSRKPACRVVSVERLSALAESQITPAILCAHGFVSAGKGPVKILGNAAVKRAVTIRGCRVSRPARQAIEKAGGRVL